MKCQVFALAMQSITHLLSNENYFEHQMHMNQNVLFILIEDYESKRKKNYLYLLKHPLRIINSNVIIHPVITRLYT